MANTNADVVRAEFASEVAAEAGITNSGVLAFITVSPYKLVHKELGGTYRYYTSDTGDRTQTGSITATGDIRTAAWAAYSPTITGWSGTPTSAFKRKKVGDLVFVSYSVDGTGDTGQTKFDLPYEAAATETVGKAGICGWEPGGGADPETIPGAVIKVVGTEAVVQDADTKESCLGTNGHVYGNGLTKWLCGHFWYVAA